MLRYIISTALVLVLAAAQPVLAEIDVVRVTPTRMPAEIQVSREQGDKIGKFKVRLRLSGPQFVTRHLTIQWHGEEVELFSMADIITERKIEVRFSIPRESIASATFHLGVGSFTLEDGVAKPDLGGTSYVINLQDFTRGTGLEVGKLGAARSAPAPKADRGGPVSDPFANDGGQTGGGGKIGGSNPIIFTKGIGILTVASERGDEAIRAEIKKQGLVEVHAVKDNIDISRVIVFLGKHDKVEVRPGSSAFVELPCPTKEFFWHAGDAPEGVGDSDLPATFTHVWCRWQADGKLNWTCYGPSEKE